MTDANGHRITRFLKYESENGLQPKGQPPAWLASLLAAYPAGSPECSIAMLHHCSLVHCAASNDESLEIWRTPADLFLCFHIDDSDKPAVATLCDGATAFLLFQAVTLGAVSLRILSEQRYAAWAERQLCERARQA
jgi:hypothetical protein